MKHFKVDIIKFLIFLFLIFSNNTYADDVSDFEIGGISVGDSALEHFTVDEIESAKMSVYEKKDFLSATLELKNSNFEFIQIEFKANDKNYIIYAMNGKINFQNKKMEDCYKLEKIILKDLKEIFSSAEYTDHGIDSHPGDPSGDSKGTWHTFELEDSGFVYLECMDWSKKMKFYDQLKLSVLTNEFNDWINY